MLTIAVSSRSLFHVEDGHQIFETEGQDAFNQYMREKEALPLRPGPAFSLVKKLLALNCPGVRDKVEVVLLSRNSPDAGMRVMNSIAHYQLDIERAVFSQGSDRFRYAKALGAQLFLSANASDVRAAIEHGLAAATMVPIEQSHEFDDMTIRIALDGDSVVFSSEADEYYRQEGLAAFRLSESAKAHIPLGDGPFRAFLQALYDLQKQLPVDNPPLKVALVTARGLPSHARVIYTLRSWGIRFHEAIFAGGHDKGPLLQAFGADLFFDDTQKNIDSATSCGIMTGHVLYGAGEGITAVR
ncbi:MAG: 5'-nucleotidase [Agitococcus sp.]|nr:5'-nucleotidase [Agitococcus sp.]MDO9177017.1 5'-nucleotidase [Agitococcus sp.]